jgi:ABC-type amino acid transport system permease subunit
MNYKDKLFEIENNQIKFRNNTFIIYLIIFVSFGTALVSMNNSILFSILGLVIASLLAFGVFIRLYWKNSIDISEISQVNIRIWNSNIDKDRNFWGIGNYKYHFPTGINKKDNPKVIFIHRKGKELAVGFVPENWENLIKVLKMKGIKIVEETFQIDTRNKQEKAVANTV